MIKNELHAEVVGLSQAMPWHEAALTELLTQQDRLPHALLLTGPAGTGMSPFGRALAGALLCESQQVAGSLGCGRCAACGWMAAGSHPDFRALNRMVDDDGKESADIKVEQFRALGDFLTVGAHRAGRRIVIIDPADALNTVTANALLKTLEEPGAGLLFILISHRIDALPATIRSRCQVYRLGGPDLDTATAWIQGTTGCSAQEAQTWLAMAGGAPLPAAHLAEPARAAAHRTMLETLAKLPDTGAVEVADALQSFEPRLWLPLLQRWVMDLGRVKQGAAPRYFPQWSGRLQELAGRSDTDRLVKAGRVLAGQFRLVGHPLNPRLFCEESLGALASAFTPIASLERGR